MRAADLDKLKQPYSDDQQQVYDDRHFADAIGVSIQPVRDLAKEIFNDFDYKVRGIGWWAPHPGTKRRILISDYLFQSVKSIEFNLVEAKLHLLELAHCDEHEYNKILKQNLASTSGNPVLIPTIKAAADELPLRLGDLHVAGFFRAIGSSLDCLGAAIIGVLGLEVNIVRASLDKALSRLNKYCLGSPATSNALWVQTRDELDKYRLQSGPPEWLEWATDYRNMLVHRARRLGIQTTQPKQPLLYGPNSVPIVESSRLLPRDPGQSEIEVWLELEKSYHVLTENGVTTLNGLFSSTTKFVELAANCLLETWRTRRNNPNLIAQPKAQWPEIPCASKRGFEGYRPGEIPFKMTMMVVNDLVLKRFRAASLDAKERHLWDQFD